MFMANQALIDWLNDQWRNYDVITGGSRTNQQQFADYMRNERSYISLLLNGKKENPSLPVVTTWYFVTGDPAIFDICGYSDKKPKEDDRSKLAGVVADTIAEMSSHGITDINSPEGANIINSVLQRRGLYRAS